MEKPMISQEQAADLLKKQGLDGHRVRLVGVRGYRPEMGKDPTANDIGVYDDAILRFIGTRCDIFEASTDPGWYYVKNPCNARGCAKLRDGLWWFELGLHKGHPALVQACEFDVDRLDEFGVPDYRESGWFGINLHSGGTGEDVGSWSAGCQVVRSDPAWGLRWMDFFNPTSATQSEK
jgi:hypothetical protein